MKKTSMTKIKIKQFIRIKIMILNFHEIIINLFRMIKIKIIVFYTNKNICKFNKNNYEKENTLTSVLQKNL